MKYLAWLLIFFVIGCGKPVVGPQGASGSIGPTGPAGATGAPGTQGVAGANGTVVTAVQFCPGYTPTYPSTFPEIGLCVDGKLYAEYYAPPSSGLVYLPDGAYVSTQTGAPCSFVVTGCGVQ